MKQRIWIGIGLSAGVVLLGLFVFLVVNCILNYPKFEISRDELMCEELTFEAYEIVRQHKSSDFYEIYFEEYEKPFQISGVVQGGLSKSRLWELAPHTVMEVYYSENDSKNYDYMICEMKQDSVVLLDLSDYIRLNQRNQVVGVIVCTMMCLVGLCLVQMMLRLFRLSIACDQNRKSKNGRAKLGVLKQEYRINDNCIQAYCSLENCSLVMNGRIVDQNQFTAQNAVYVMGFFRLRGELKQGKERTPVEARIGLFKMRLYYDGRCVDSRWI